MTCKHKLRRIRYLERGQHDEYCDACGDTLRKFRRERTWVEKHYEHTPTLDAHIPSRQTYRVGRG